MSSKTVTASAKKSKNKKKIRHMHIEKIDNGFTATTHYHPPDGDMMSMPPDPSVKAFDTPEEVGQHVADSFGGASDQTASANSPANESEEE